MTLGAEPMRKQARGTRWIGILLTSWVILQLADIFTTYWGLSTPKIVEANPLMASVISLPTLTVALKMALTFGAAGVLRYLEERCGISSLPMLVALNVLMLYVLINNSSVIAQSGDLSLPRLASPLASR